MANGSTEITVTFDVDWAPDWAIDECVALCRAAQAKSTFFITHASDILDDLRRAGDIETGIHPNFLPRSSHGETTEAVLDHCLALVPEARSMRTHALIQSSPLLAHIVRNTPIDVDVSLFLPFHSGVAPMSVYFEESSRPLKRLPFGFEDDLAACRPGWSWTQAPLLSAPGPCVYDFHPIHIALNSDSLTSYRALLRALDGRPLAKASRAECAPFVNQGYGAATYLRRVLETVASNGSLTVSKTAASFGELSCASR